MKRSLGRCFVFLICLVLLPGLAMLVSPVFPAEVPSLKSGTGFHWQKGFGRWQLLNRPEAASSEGEGATPPAELVLPAAYRVLDAESGEVLSLSPAEYIIGVLAGEMPASYEEEALKAQAVAAHSYALWQAGRQLEDPDPALKGAILSTDPGSFQAYLSEEDRRALWGDSFEVNEEKLRSAVEEVISLILTYNGEPVAAAFHALSSGETESAETVWGQAEPCLTPVSSPWDAESPDLTAETAFTSQEASAILSAHLESPVLEEDPSEWITVLKRTDSGTVAAARAGGAEVTGTEIREWFGLPSANFEVSISDGAIVFTTKGKGHGVGMSQYGANAMAAEGKAFSEILLYYYPGAELTVLQTSEGG